MRSSTCSESEQFGRSHCVIYVYTKKQTIYKDNSHIRAGIMRSLRQGLAVSGQAIVTKSSALLAVDTRSPTLCVSSLVFDCSQALQDGSICLHPKGVCSDCTRSQGQNLLRGVLSRGHDHTRGVGGDLTGEDRGVDDKDVVCAIDLRVGIDHSRAVGLAAVVGAHLVGTY